MAIFTKKRNETEGQLIKRMVVELEAVFNGSAKEYEAITNKEFPGGIWYDVKKEDWERLKEKSIREKINATSKKIEIDDITFNTRGHQNLVHLRLKNAKKIHKK